MLEDRPPGNEERISITVDLLAVSRWFKNRNKEEQPDDSNNSISNIKCLASPSEIDQRIDDILAAGNGSRNRDREEECCIGSRGGSCGK